MFNDYETFATFMENLLRVEKVEGLFISDYLNSTDLKPVLIVNGGLFNKVFRIKQDVTSVKDVLDHFKSKDVISTENIFAQLFDWSKLPDWSKRHNLYKEKYLRAYTNNPQIKNVDEVIKLFEQFLRDHDLLNEYLHDLVYHVKDRYETNVNLHRAWKVGIKENIDCVFNGLVPIDEFRDNLINYFISYTNPKRGIVFWEDKNKEWEKYVDQYPINFTPAGENYKPIDKFKVAKMFVDFINTGEFNYEIRRNGKWTTLPNLEFYARKTLIINRHYFEYESAMNLLSDAFNTLDDYWKGKDEQWRKYLGSSIKA